MSVTPNVVTNEIKQLCTNSIQEIASSISFENFCVMLPIGNGKDLYPHVQDLLVKTMEEAVAAANEEFVEYVEKARKLQQMSEQKPKDYVAWRPTTGKISTVAFEVHALKMKEAELLKKIAEMDVENDRLRQTIIDKRKVLSEQKDKLKKVDVKFS